MRVSAIKIRREGYQVLGQITGNRRYSLFEFFVIFMSGVIGIIKPGLSFWFILVPPIFYLEDIKANMKEPDHKGVTKSLGYSLLRMVELDRAYGLLIKFPVVSGGELDAYYWWWQTQDRDDLSVNAFLGIDILKNGSLSQNRTKKK